MNKPNASLAANAVASGLPQVLTEGKVLGLINHVTKTARDNQKEMHEAAWQALAYAHKTNNATPLAMLANDLPNSSRTDALMAWAKAFAPVSFHHQKTKDGDKLYTEDGRPQLVVKLRKGRTAADWNLAGAYKVAFFDFRKPNVQKEMDVSFIHAIQAYIKRMDSLLKRGGDVERMQNIQAQRDMAEQMLANVQA
jgi:hypothetical protein